MKNTSPIPSKSLPAAKWLHTTSNQHTRTRDAYAISTISTTSIPISNTASTLDSPSQSDARKHSRITFTAEVVLHCTCTTSIMTSTQSLSIKYCITHSPGSHKGYSRWHKLPTLCIHLWYSCGLTLTDPPPPPPPPLPPSLLLYQQLHHATLECLV